MFSAGIQDWEPHLRTIAEFWTSVVLMRGAYERQPMSKYVDLPWLPLWEETAGEVCSAAAAERFIALARRIGESMELGVAGRGGVLLPKGERLPPNGRAS